MTSAAQCTKNAITLKGSAQIIANYLSKTKIQIPHMNHP